MTNELVALSGDDVARLLEPELLMDALENAFRDLSAGRASVPPRIAAAAAEGSLIAMPGYVNGALAAKLISWFGGNPARGLPAAQAAIVVFDASDGRPIGLVDGTEVTARRTAAASAVSARRLARDGSRVLAVIGAGVQGDSHIAHVRLVRAFGEVRIASRTARHAEELARRHGVRACGSVEEAVRGADVVCLCTHSSAPVIEREWLTDGCHVTSVGWVDGGSELDAATLRAAHLFVESRAAFEPHPAGAWELQGMDPSAATELGELISGGRPGRTDDREITVYKSTGHAAEDVTAARLALERARAVGVGQRIRI